MGGLDDAVGRFNESNNEPADQPDLNEPEPSNENSGGKGHTFHVQKTTGGTYHLTAEGDNGELVHHSEHASLEEAADEMKNHGED